MGRPGIMLYFDILEPIRVLPDSDKGKLLVAMLKYGRDGIVPEFDGMLALAWGFVRPKLDKDQEEYNRTVLKRMYATACRDRKKKGEEDISFEDWLMTIDNQSNHMISHDIKWYPTTTTTTTTTPATSTTTKTTATTAAAVTTNDDAAATASENVLKPFGGKLGKDVVLLTDAQVEDLLERMGVEAFDNYVEKLSGFIIKNDARVASHYDTILKWWRQDSRVEA